MHRHTHYAARPVIKMHITGHIDRDLFASQWVSCKDVVQADARVDVVDVDLPQVNSLLLFQSQTFNVRIQSESVCATVTN